MQYSLPYLIFETVGRVAPCLREPEGAGVVPEGVWSSLPFASSVLELVSAFLEVVCVTSWNTFTDITQGSSLSSKNLQTIQVYFHTK